MTDVPSLGTRANVEAIRRAHRERLARALQAIQDAPAHPDGWKDASDAYKGLRKAYKPRSGAPTQRSWRNHLHALTRAGVIERVTESRGRYGTRTWVRPLKRKLPRTLKEKPAVKEAARRPRKRGRP